YDFFSNVAPEIQAVIESRLNTDSNSAPVAAGQNVSATEDVSRNITLSASDAENNALIYSVVAAPQHGTLSGTGANLTYTPAADYFGTDSFTFRANDGTTNSNTATININVAAVNDAPVANTDSKTTGEDQALVFPATDLTTNDSAGAVNETNQLLTVTKVITTPNVHGQVTLLNGQITYVPETDYQGSASFDYQICDNGTTNGAPDAKCGVGIVNVTINSVNDAPVLATIGAQTVDEDVALTFTASANDSDGDALSYSLVNVPAAASGAVIDPSSGVFNATFNDPGIYRITVVVIDNGSPTLSDEEEIVITVLDKTAPVIGNAPGDQTLEAANSNGSAASWNVPSANDNTDGIVAVECSRASGSVFALGSTIVTCTATDRAGNAASHSFTITVRDTTAPGLNLPANISVNTATNSAVVNWTASATDIVSGSVAVVCNPASGSTFALGQATVSCSATDGAGNMANGSFLVTVVDNAAPTISIASPASGAIYTIGQPVAASYSCGDAGSGINTCAGTTANGALIDTSSVGSKSFIVTASDNAGNRTMREIAYTVGFGISALFDQTKANNSGSTIPVQLRIIDSNGNNLSAASIQLKAVRVEPGNIPVQSPGNSNPANAFSFDSASQSYKYNLKTEKNWTPGTYRLVFSIAGDPAERFVEFVIR
ncbi:MAG TPA: Ig-like domain-containing protein, partial [Pyrinomonadaceae bacterium]